jgi:predicted DNA-binding protein (MmcQ/YjbR family)
MRIDQLRDYCLSKPGVEESSSFGADILLFKVTGKVFLICGIENIPLQFNVKCDPALALELREQYSCVLPGYHMNKKHWNTIVVDGSVDTEQLHWWIDHSYDLVKKIKSKKVKNNKGKSNS